MEGSFDFSVQHLANLLADRGCVPYRLVSMEQQMQRSIGAGYPANCEYPVQAEPAEAHTPKLEHYAQEPEPKGKSKSRVSCCMKKLYFLLRKTSCGKKNANGTVFG